MTRSENVPKTLKPRRSCVLSMDTLALFRKRFGQLLLERYPSLDRFYLEHDFSKGHLSHILRGTRNPSTLTLHKLADMLGVELVDFFIFPEQDKRHQIMGLLADCSEETLDAVLRHLLERTQGSKALVEAKRG